MATGPISEAGFEALVAALHGLPGAEAAATRLGPVSGHGTCFTDREPPLVLARVLAEDDIALRAAMRVALAALRPGRQALPRHVANEYGWDA